MNRSSRCTFAVVVASCDAFADVWPVHLAMMQLNWPECHLPVYFLTNELAPESAAVTSILVGRDKSWSDNLRTALEALSEDYVLLTLDDLMLTEPVQTSILDDVFSWIAVTRPNCLRLTTPPPPDLVIDDRFGRIEPGSLYRTGTIWSVWKREVLHDLLVPGETAWEFELEGSKRSDKYNDFYSTRKSVVHVANAIVRGKWDPRVLCILSRQGVISSTVKRLVMTRSEVLRYRASIFRSHLLYLLPSRYRRRIRQFVKSVTRGSV
jgi:hypothetical protein